MKSKFKLLGLAVAAAACATSAYAIPTLTLSDGIAADTVTLTSASGDIFFNGVIGNWTINVTTAIGSPPDVGLGTAGHPYLDLNTVQKYNGSAATLGSVLTVTFTDDYPPTGFGPTGPGSFVTETGGTLRGITVGVNTLLNNAVINSQLFTTSPYSLTSSTAIPGAPLSGYSLGIQDVFTATPGTVGNLSLDTSVTVPDGGLTVAMLGFVLVGIDGLRRKLAK